MPSCGLMVFVRLLRVIAAGTSGLAGWPGSRSASVQAGGVHRCQQYCSRPRDRRRSSSIRPTRRPRKRAATSPTGSASWGTPTTSSAARGYRAGYQQLQARRDRAHRRPRPPGRARAAHRHRGLGREQRPPLVQDESDDAESGRGLLLMAQLVHDWGVRPLNEEGKITWARCAR